MFRKMKNRSAKRNDLRKFLLEPLERRRLMAADAAEAFGSSFWVTDVSGDDFNGMGAMVSVGQSFGMGSGRTGFSGRSDAAPFQFSVSGGDDGSFAVEINESNADLFGDEVGGFESSAVVSGRASGANAVSEVVEFELNESNMEAVLKGLPKDLKPAQPLKEGTYASEMFGADVADYESGSVVEVIASGAMPVEDMFVFEINESNMDAVLKGLPKDLKPAQPLKEGTYASEMFGADVADYESGSVVEVIASGAMPVEDMFVFEINESNMDAVLKGLPKDLKPAQPLKEGTYASEMFGADVADYESGSVVEVSASGAMPVEDMFVFEINESNMDAVLKGLPKDLKPAQPLKEGTYASEMFGADVADYESGSVVEVSASGAMPVEDMFVFEINESNMDAVLKGLPKDLKPAQPLKEGTYASEMFGADVADYESGSVVEVSASGAMPVEDMFEFEINESNMDAVLKGLPKDLKPAQPLKEGNYASEMFGADVADYESGSVVEVSASGAMPVEDMFVFEINESNMDAVLKGLPKDVKPAQPVTEGTYASELYGAEVGGFESGTAVSGNTSGAVTDEVGFVLELNENGDGFSFEIDESMLGLLATGFPTDVTPSASSSSKVNLSQVGSGLSTGVLSPVSGGVGSQQNANSSVGQVVVNKVQVGSTGVSKAASQPGAGLFSQQVVQKRLRAGAWSQQELVDLALSDLLRV